MRLAQHKRSKWFRQIHKVTIKPYADRAKALKAETLAISRGKPRFNRQKRQLPKLVLLPPNTSLPKILSSVEQEPERVLTVAEAEAVEVSLQKVIKALLKFEKGRKPKRWATYKTILSLQDVMQFLIQFTQKHQTERESVKP